MVASDQVQEIGDVQEKENLCEDRPLRNSVHNSLWQLGGHKWADVLRTAAHVQTTK